VKRVSSGAAASSIVRNPAECDFVAHRAAYPALSVTRVTAAKLMPVDREIGDAGTKTIFCAYRTLAGSGAMALGRGFGMSPRESARPVVLIVEDDFLLRIDAADMIKAAGFEVIEAGNADQAIKVLEARPDITVVFTDIQMPGSMDGLKLARAVRGRWPPIKIIATSGRLNIGETDLPEGGRFLPKPYSRAQVAHVLRELTIGA
jgi:CheY-like chemotaxis protein